ncbi:NAD(P)-dependent oxidoreductase [Halococcus dombrowskii]|uniref:NAD(P)-dependent oxidoreductase n=1 Tax=Halococcus dombrowskii TaxID=179637 RepID=A0AAV3SER6_HALDO|nr:NAD(P)-dependent oxidoreductase [Halococcus dombrowskii]UOO95090.1 NAD(P)-dependent oxidoreductase [Halococcus dombrowskii]
MQLLVVGANGLLGSNVIAKALARDWECTGTYHSTEPTFDIPLHELDVRDTDRFTTILDANEFDAVLNCAAMTDVDGCEENPEHAHAINGAAPGELARVCADRELAFCHVSTDYVFDGDAERRYAESAPTNPQQVYGESKLTGERTVRKAHDGALLARLSFVYGTHGATGTLTGFPAWVGDRLRKAESIPLFTDQTVTPSRAGQAAATLIDLLAADVTGTVHIASRSCITPYEFGERIRERLAASRSMDVPAELLAEGSQSAVDRAATRPLHTCLDVGTVEHALDRDQPALAGDLDSIADAL